MVASRVLVGLVAVIRKLGKYVEQRAGALLGFLSGFAQSLTAAVDAGRVGALADMDALGRPLCGLRGRRPLRGPADGTCAVRREAGSGRSGRRTAVTVLPPCGRRRAESAS
jgi:hypothetical protein